MYVLYLQEEVSNLYSILTVGEMEKTFLTYSIYIYIHQA